MTVRLSVKVIPGASRDAVAEWMEETLKVRVSAPPERGKANAAVERLLEKTLDLPRNSARVIQGKTSPRKIVEISGLSEAEVHRRLSKPD